MDEEERKRLNREFIDATRRALIERYEIDPFVLAKVLAEEIDGVPTGDGSSLHAFFEAKAGNDNQIFERMTRKDGTPTLLDRITLRLIHEGIFRRKAGRKKDAQADIQTRDLVEWLKLVHGYPKDAAVERAGELLGLSGRAIWKRLRAAPEPSTLFETIKALLGDLPQDPAKILFFQDIIFPGIALPAPS